jgi:hypothetical protein
MSLEEIERRMEQAQDRLQCLAMMLVMLTLYVLPPESVT